MRPSPAVVLALFSFPLLAQSPYTEKIEVSVVNVDVTVTDWHGNPVRGLTKEDFQVLEDGVPQPITNFYAVDRHASAANTDERFRRKVLVLIDTMTTTPFERNQALAHLENLINDRFQTGEYDWSIASAGIDLRLLLPPTSDKNAIHEALNQIRSNHAPLVPMFSQTPHPATPLGTFLKELEERSAKDAIDKHIDAIVEATRAFGATNGKKIILLLTGQLLPDDRTMGDLSLARAIADERNWMIREANASNVNLYIVNPEGISAGDPSMYWLARQTGGRLMPGNDVAASLQQFDARSSNFYSLGYRPLHPDDGKYHRIGVRLKRPGYFRLQYREGYSSLTSEKQLDRTMQSAVGPFMMSRSDFPVTVAFGPLRSVEGGVIATLKTIVPTNQIAFIPTESGKAAHVDIAISIFDSTGHNTWYVRLDRDAQLNANDAPEGTFVENTEVEFEKGTPYRVIVAVHDKVTDSIGLTQQIVQF